MQVFAGSMMSDWHGPRTKTKQNLSGILRGNTNQKKQNKNNIASVMLGETEG